MALDLIAARSGEWRTALQRALAHPQVVELARRFQVDLADETRRNSLLQQAEDRLSMMTEPAVPSPVAEPALPVEMPTYRVDEALRAYREISQL